MQEAPVVVVAAPRVSRGLEEREGAEHVGANEGGRRRDAAIDVGLGGEVDHGVEVVLGEEARRERFVGHVAVHEQEARVRAQRLEVPLVARVRQEIEHHELLDRAFVEEPPRDGAADEPRAARQEHAARR